MVVPTKPCVREKVTLWRHQNSRRRGLLDYTRMTRKEWGRCISWFNIERNKQAHMRYIKCPIDASKTKKANCHSLFLIAFHFLDFMIFVHTYKYWDLRDHTLTCIISVYMHLCACMEIVIHGRIISAMYYNYLYLY